MIVHLINEKFIELDEARHFSCDENFVEFYDKEDNIIAAVNTAQIVWINIVD